VVLAAVRDAEGVTMKEEVVVDGSPLSPVKVDRTVEVDGSIVVSRVVEVEAAGEEELVKVVLG
jgi:hypothetical protein